MFGASARRFRYPELLQGNQGIGGAFRYHPHDIYPGGLGAWRSLKLVARQSFGGHRAQEERYHDMIEWTILVGCLVRLSPRKLRTVVYVCSMEPIVYAVSNDRSEPTHGAANASGVRPTSATSCCTETPRARSPRCPGASAGALSQVSIFFPRCVSRTRNHVARNESV